MTITVTGRAEVSAYIGGIPAKLQKVLAKAGKEASAVLVDGIKARTPSEEVRDGIRSKQSTRDGRIVIRIDVEKGWARSLATWLEFGTSPHFISVDDSQRGGRSVGRINRQTAENDGNASLVIGGSFVGATVFHPGARPVPAFRPTLDLDGQEAVAAAQTYINSAVSRGLVAVDAGGGDAA